NADLRDSGSIEQDADSIIMLYREAVYDENSSAAPFAEIIVTNDVDALPKSDAMMRHVDDGQALRWALSGGEDYELCFTVPELNR
ncbi:hypothetical protein ONO57_25235, partial [Salmonella enterica subsp. enterica serovar Anatum]|nr:hypothetical protein [Salmonella enterica subsp. enterica serovar Anatum]